MSTATREQLAAIHVLKAQARLDDETYRDFLERETGYRSAKLIAEPAAGKVIEKLRDLAGGGKAAGAVAGLDTPLAAKLRALWIAGYNLGLVRDRTDRDFFLERQTGVSHTKFLTDPRQGTQAVEGLKAWLARNGVSWPSEKEDSEAIGSRRAIIDAQWLKLMSLNAFATNDPLSDLLPFARRTVGIIGAPEWNEFGPHDLDRVQAAIGRRLRTAIGSERGETAA